MREEKINGKKVLFFDSVENAPIRNYEKFNKGIVIDLGIGSDLDAINSHIKDMYDYINADKKEFALQSLSNYHQSLIFIIENQNPKLESFKALIHSIDGHPPTYEILKSLNPTKSMVDKIVSWFKKKVKMKLV
jgi:paraquat-inducible protein B